jgi:hypothetical protein
MRGKTGEHMMPSGLAAPMPRKGDLAAGAWGTIPVHGEVAEWLKAAPC